MTERELEKRLHSRFGADSDVVAPLGLRTQVAAIPDAVTAPAWGLRRIFQARRPLTLLVAGLLLMLLAVGGAVAVGSGLLRLPWQTRVPVDLAGIDPCSLVSGGPSREIAVNDQGEPAIGAEHIVDYENWINGNHLAGALTPIGGSECFFLLPADGSRSQDSVLQLREQATTGAEAQEIVAMLFAPGPTPFSSGALVEQIAGQRAWVGILDQRAWVGILDERSAVHWGEITPRMAVAVFAEPYFFAVTFDIDESILNLSDAARAIWWDTYWETSFWPGIRVQAAEIVANLKQLEVAAGH